MNQATQAQSVPSAFEELMRVDVTSWKGVAAQVNDPVTARLIVETLDAHPKLRERRLGVYMAARVTVQRSRITYARARDAGRQVAFVISGLQRIACALFGGSRRTASAVAGAVIPASVQPRSRATDLDAAEAFGFNVREVEGEELKFPPIAYPEDGDQAVLH